MKHPGSVALLVTAIVLGPAAAAAQRIGLAGGVTTLSNGVVLVVAPPPAPASGAAAAPAPARRFVPRLQPVSSAILREALQTVGVAATPSGAPFTLSLLTPLVPGRGLLKAGNVTFNADSQTILLDGPMSVVSVFVPDTTTTRRFMLQFTVATLGWNKTKPFVFSPGNQEAFVAPSKYNEFSVQEILVMVTMPEHPAHWPGGYLLASMSRPGVLDSFFLAVQVTPM